MSQLGGSSGERTTLMSQLVQGPRNPNRDFTTLVHINIFYIATKVSPYLLILLYEGLHTIQQCV